MAYEFEKTYWCDNGKYQKEYDELLVLVPASGMAGTTNGEALRCLSNIYYDAYNNGGGNFDIRYPQWQYLKHWINSIGVTADTELIDRIFEDSQTDEYGVLLENCSPDVPVWGKLEDLTDAVIAHIIGVTE